MQGGRMCEAREKKESRADSQHSQERQVRATDMSPETMCVCECVCGLCERQWQEMEGGGEKNAEEEEEESSGAHRERVGDLYKILS